MSNNQEKNRQYSIEDYATVEAICDGAPVYSFNHLVYIYGQSPDLYPDVINQENNHHPVNKLTLKKSWEIKNNFFGFCHEMTPRTRFNDSQPYLPIHLIDGDPTTMWASFESFMPEDQEEWIRIDLPIESPISSVSLKCIYDYMGRKDKERRWHWGNSLPRELTVKLSCDAWHWKTIFETEDSRECREVLRGDHEKPNSVDIVLKEPIRGKQIWIGGKGFTGIGYNGTMFSINGVEVLDPKGRNLALISNGAGVTVSSTSDAHNSDRYSANTLWGPLQYDLGVKWVKLGSDNGSSLWCFTEHEKGKLIADENMNAAVTEAVNHGINIIMTLDFMGNWIYEDPPHKTNWKEARFREINESYICGVPHVDSNPEMFAGYLKYVEYMANHFKDRVAYFEIGNEYKFGKDDDVNWYKNVIFEPTYEIIKRVAPESKICLCGTNGFQADDILCLLGDGVTLSENTLHIQGKTLLTVNDTSFCDAIVKVDAQCNVPHGIILRYNTINNFLAALYDPNSGEIYFAEMIGHNNWDGAMIIFQFTNYEYKRKTPAPDLQGIVNMTVTSEGNIVSFTISDGNNSYTAEYQTDKVEAGGNVGIIQDSGIETGKYSNFNVTDLTGKVLFADDFSADDTTQAKWFIACNHWGDKTKPPLSERIDAVGWHPVEYPDIKYFNAVKALRDSCRILGFKGEYFANEIYAGAAYPPGPAKTGSDLWYERELFRLSDIREAKSYIGSMVGHGSLHIESGPCHVHFTGFPHPQAACRTTVPSQVVAPCQPKPTYYAIRNISTAMDDFYECIFPVSFSDDADLLYFTLENSCKTQRMLAVYLQAPWSDDAVCKKLDIFLPGMAFKSAYAIDTFNGTEQELIISCNKNDSVLKDIVVKDYPMLIKWDV